MKYVNPNEVAGKILSIVAEAQDRLVIVSPYNKFRGWSRFERAIQDVLDRGVSVAFYTRADDDSGNEYLKEVGIEPILVPNLHAKVYFNERRGLITSMNLLKSSVDTSIEVGAETECDTDLAALVEFERTYLSKYRTNPIPIESADLPDEVGNIYEAICFYIERGLEQAGAPPVEIIYQSRGKTTRILVGHRDFDVDWDFRNKTLFAVGTLILPTVVWDFLYPQRTQILRGLPISPEFLSGDGRHYNLYQFGVALGESKLRDCSRKQVADAAALFAEAVLRVLIPLATTADTELNREIYGYHAI